MAKDILLFMSDQHSYRLQGYAGDPVIRTPMLDQLAAEGTVLEKAMTSCPLCVPARASMISGQLPSNNGVLFNFNGLSSDQATFLHSLNLSGYETVLCGRVYEAFQQYLSRTGREGIFIYVSDHGDMNGSRGYYGKQVFYEPSVHIPFVFAGAGIAKGRRISSPVSLMDMGPTVCELVGAKVLPGDGKSLAPLLTGEGSDEERIVISEQYTYCSDGRTSLGRMCRYKERKTPFSVTPWAVQLRKKLEL